MAEEVQRVVRTDFIVNDKASAPLKAIAGNAGRISGIFNKASSIMGTFGGVAALAAGAFSAKDAIAGTMKYLDSVKRISDVTGMSASNADALLETFEKADISAGEAQRIIQRMTGTMAKAQMHSQGFRANMRGSGNLAKQLGIDMRKGPEHALVQMSTLAAKGKITADKLRMAYYIPYDTARKMMNLLAMGPAKLRELMGELQKRGIAVTAQNIADYKRMKSAQREITSNWERIRMLVVMRLIPVFADFMEYVKDHLDGWIDKAKQFGDTLAGFLRNHHRMIVNTGKVLLANFLLMKATGGAGAGEMAWRGGKAVMGSAVGGAGPMAGVVSKFAALGPGLIIAAAAAATIAISVKAWGDNVLGVQDFVTLNFERIKAYGAMLEKSMMKVLSPMIKMFGIKPGGLGSLVLKLAALPLMGLSKAAELFAHYIAAAWRFIGMLGDAISGPAMMESISLLWDGWQTFVFDPITSFLKWLTTPIVALYDLWKTYVFDNLKIPIIGLYTLWQEYVFDPILFSLGKVWEFIKWITSKISALIPGGVKSTVGAVAGAPVAAAAAVGNMAKRAWLETGMQADAAAQQAVIMAKIAEGFKHVEDVKKQIRNNLTKDKPPPTNMDFRGSRFDIEQRFAEGFDPDRIATAFSNDLALLGERRLQSGFAPLFSVR